MISKRTINTLFMLSSVDGKISTGNSDKRDVDRDFPKLKGIKEGLQQYYDLERHTDLHSFSTGRVMAKIGMNKKKKGIKKLPVSFIIVDNSHLNDIGISNLLKKCKKLYLVTTNKNHSAMKTEADNLEIIYYKDRVNFQNLFVKLKGKFKIGRVTIQSGGTLNSILIRAGLIDRLSLVMAPALIGGKNTSTLVDGESLVSDKELRNIKALNLVKIKKLKNSYLQLDYRLIN